jgi:phosphosulfolactate synthase (CoM biosynthesis protein A)
MSAQASHAPGASQRFVVLLHRDRATLPRGFVREYAWRTDVVSEIVEALGMSKIMFEAAGPAVFEWYIKNYGPEVNLFVDHSQIVQLEALRSGIWVLRALGTNLHV